MFCNIYLSWQVASGESFLTERVVRYGLSEAILDIEIAANIFPYDQMIAKER